MSSITIKEAKNILNFAIDNNLKRSILLLSAPGVGKSSICRQVAKAHNMNLIDMRLLYYEPADLKGIPAYNKERHTTEWLPNDILPQADRDGERGILLLDEFTSASKRTLAAAYQLCLDRRLGEYKLPDGWFIVAAGNRESDQGVYVQLPSPLANRFQIHEIHPSVEVWKSDYAYRHGIHPLVIAFLGYNPNLLHTQKPDDDTLIFASPRSWEAVSDILNANPDVMDFTGNESKREFIFQLIAGNISEIVAGKFLEFCRLRSSLAVVDDILEGRPYKVPTDNSLVFGIISSIVSRTVESVKDTNKFPKHWIKNSVSFFTKLSPEFFAVGIRDISSIAPKTMKKLMLTEIDDPMLEDFIENHKYLFV